MFDTLVWATDGSELADSALPVVTALARAHGSRIVAVHANELFRGGRSHGGPILADDDELRLKIAKQVADLRNAGVAADLEVVTSGKHHAPRLIADAASERAADLIVLCT